MKAKGGMDEHEKQHFKRERTSLENEIDRKLLTYSKSGSEPAPDAELGGAPGSSHVLEKEIEQLLENLGKVNESIAALETDSRAERQLNEHHREVLQEYRNCYKNTKAKLKAKRERQELLQSCRRDIQDFKDQHGTSLLAQERDSLGKVHGIADQIISTAQMSRERLNQQRSTFGNIMDKTSTLLAKFPVVNELIQKIQRKKQRDMIIISLVIAVCLFLVWLYWK
eukprot:RCo032735